MILIGLWIFICGYILFVNIFINGMDNEKSYFGNISCSNFGIDCGKCVLSRWLYFLGRDGNG